MTTTTPLIVLVRIPGSSPPARPGNAARHPGSPKASEHLLFGDSLQFLRVADGVDAHDQFVCHHEAHRRVELAVAVDAPRGSPVQPNGRHCKRLGYVREPGE